MLRDNPRRSLHTFGRRFALLIAAVALAGAPACDEAEIDARSAEQETGGCEHGHHGHPGHRPGGPPKPGDAPCPEGEPKPPPKPGDAPCDPHDTSAGEETTGEASTGEETTGEASTGEETKGGGTTGPESTGDEPLPQ